VVDRAVAGWGRSANCSLWGIGGDGSCNCGGVPLGSERAGVAACAGRLLRRRSHCAGTVLLLALDRQLAIVDAKLPLQLTLADRVFFCSVFCCEEVPLGTRHLRTCVQ